MERIFASRTRTLIIKVTGSSVITRSATGRPTTRNFRNRYALRKFVTQQMQDALSNGFVSVNR